MARTVDGRAARISAAGNGWNSRMRSIPTRSPAATRVSTVSSTAPLAEPMTMTTRSASGAPWYSTSPYCRPVRAASSSMTPWTMPGTARWNGFEASRAWKKTSGFWAVPRTTGASGVRPRVRKARTSSSRTSARMSSSSRTAILLISCDVRKPSKKCRNGTRARRVEAWATSAKSCASWTELAASIAQPVVRACITSLWSPKIDRAWVATVRAATWMTAGVSSPQTLNMLGTMSRSPCDAVNVVASAPFWRAPWRAPAAPASDCISTTSGTLPQMFGRPAAAQSSQCSAIGVAGVIG